MMASEAAMVLNELWCGTVAMRDDGLRLIDKQNQEQNDIHTPCQLMPLAVMKSIKRMKRQQAGSNYG
jgi:hypothetical protein